MFFIIKNETFTLAIDTINSERAEAKRDEDGIKMFEMRVLESVQIRTNERASKIQMQKLRIPIHENDAARQTGKR